MASPADRTPSAAPARVARRVVVEGVVQGVGFRPFVWRLATELGLDGSVLNLAGRVEAVVAGEPDAVEAFAARIATDAPPRARVERVTVLEADGAAPATAPGSGFVIDESVAAASAERLFPPDIATCDDCVRELWDPADRRYRYPFINCTNCGPRATIIDDLPYDRARTSMRAFPLCADCEREYRDPADRRFHAEPVACPACGPSLAYRPSGAPAPTARAEDALAATVADLLAGRIVAIKGLGGYHLACDATDAAAVARLRDRKRRWAKPFAVMVRDLDGARAVARVDEAETELLASPARPIVLVPLRVDASLDPGVTNGNRHVGLFLPYAPLHHLLMAAVGRPIVLTSGNLSDEPIVMHDAEALERLAPVADAFLQHDREIRARYDDSVTRAVGEGAAARASIIRRGRGYAPDPLDIPVATPVPLLAVGAELKHTFTLARGSRAHVAPHTGDLEDLLVHRAFEENLAHLARLLDLAPDLVVHDLHPAYLSTQYAVARFAAERRVAVQHHHAHVASAAAENGHGGRFIGVAYDGLGMGDDGTFWGGEILVADLAGYRRVGRFGLAPMPGGALAVKRPYRMALGYLLGAEEVAGGPATEGAGDAGARLSIDPDLATPFVARLDPREVEVVRVQIARGLNAPVASSAGRLFDAVSSLLGLRDVAEYEAQAAVDLETAAADIEAAPLPSRLVRTDGILVYDPRPTLAAVLERHAAGEPPGVIAAAFHATIVAVTEELVDAAVRETGIRTVALSGGVFQNQRIAGALAASLRRAGLEVLFNERVPANDGGISYGQSAVAAARLAAGAG
ncbi:MAG: carbamoyltransferase HypF [Chloroflexi bacterium]|jgi:hydrogenase maturation protein HypF|nr:carbamoyltransferase HypF [Chloroflexota bacterium]